jgi:glycosyltransferase involved in cell wall biosynthesis
VRSCSRPTRRSSIGSDVLGQAPTRMAVVTPIMAPYRTPVFNALADRDEVDLLVLYQSEGSPIHEWEPRRDAAKFHHEVLPHAAAFGSGIRRVWVSRRLVGRLARFRPHVVVIGGYNQPVTWEILAARRFLGYEAWIWLESTAADSRKNGIVREAAKRSLVRWADGILVPGSASGNYAVSLGADPERVRLAPNAVDVGGLAAAAAAADRDAIRGLLGLVGTVFVYVGRIVREKGVFDLLEAFQETIASVNASGDECSLLVVGDGPQMGTFVEQVRARGISGVATVGFVQQEELPGLLAASDVMVFPTWSDPWGLVLNEAQACGLPAIATTVAGASSDLLGETGAGLLVRKRSPRELSRAMVELAMDESLRRSMAQAARETSRRFTPSACAAGFAEVGELARRWPRSERRSG